MEETLLSALLTYEQIQNQLIPMLSPQYFSFAEHEEIFRAIQNLFAQNRKISFIEVAEYLRQQNPESAPALETLLTERLARILVGEQEAREIYEQIRRRFFFRKIAEISRNLYEKATHPQQYEPVQLAHQGIEALQELLHEGIVQHAVSVHALSSEVLSHLYTVVQQKAEGARLLGIGSGFPHLDRITGGWRPGDYIVVAARTSMGKTAFALNLALHAARMESIPVLIFSLEMSGEQIAMRILSILSGIPLHQLRNAELSMQDFEALEKALNELQEVPLYIDDSGELTIADLRARATLAHHQHHVRMVVVDYLQQVQAMLDRRSGTREQEVSFVSRSLKALAKELNIPVIAVAQVSRQAELRADNRPKLSDLRESGAIEQDADMVLFLYRPGYYRSSSLDQEKFPGHTEVIVAKNRNGPVGTCHIKFLRETASFQTPSPDELAKVEDAPPHSQEGEFSEKSPHEEEEFPVQGVIPSRANMDSLPDDMDIHSDLPGAPFSSEDEDEIFPDSSSPPPPS